MNLESLPLSMGSHEWVADWSLVSLQEVNSEKKSFLMAHKYHGESEPAPVFFLESAQTPGKNRRRSSEDPTTGRERGAEGGRGRL